MQDVRRGVTLALVLTATVAGGAVTARPYMHGLSFVVRAADMHGRVRHLADLDTRVEHEHDVTIPAAGRSIRGRVYQPEAASHRTALLVSGLHPSGIDEPRLVRLARQLSASGITVVTPDIPELSQFEITPAITDAIEASARWLASDSGLASDHRVALMGISFSGGLSIVAAARPALAGRVAYVFSFGGHDDLPRVLRYLCTGTEPYPSPGIQLTVGGTDAAGTGRTLVRPPHDYGVAVILLAAAERLVPRAQVEPLRTAVRRFLFASALDSDVDKPRAAQEFAALKLLQKKLPEPSASLLRYVNDRDVVHLGSRLLPYISSFAGDPALSVSKSPKPAVPVFLLHGSEDNVIPPVESEYLEADLRGHAPIRLLMSGLISHAEADRPVHVGDVLQLAGFWGDVLSR
jgi:dienelactone hydrolase